MNFLTSGLTVGLPANSFSKSCLKDDRADPNGDLVKIEIIVHIKKKHFCVRTW